MPRSAYHRGWSVGRGDLTHAQTGDVTEILLPGDGTATHSRQLHIAQAGDANSDWGLAAQTDPLLALHSVTTPTTDYATWTHNGSNLVENVAGGCHAWQIAGTTEMSLSATVLDLAGVNLQLQACGDILDNNGNESLSFVTAACAVNEFTMTNAAANGAPDFSVTGGDTNITMAFTTKATGHFRFDPGGTEAFALHDTTCNPVTASTSGVGHPVFMYTAPGLAACGASCSTAGGLWTLETGVGGAGDDTCNAAGSAGGALTITTGIGGASGACNTAAGGAGGLLCLSGGDGGTAATACTGNAGAGGAVTITGGTAGAIAGTGTGAPAVGGVVTITGGVGSRS